MLSSITSFTLAEGAAHDTLEAMPHPQSPGRPRRRLRIGTIWIDVLSFDEALREIERLVDGGQGGAVFTPNVDHVVKAESNEAFRRAYEHASLSLADGMPLVWVGGLLGCPLPERIAGSDLLVPLLEMAATASLEGLLAGWRARGRGGHGSLAQREAGRPCGGVG